MWEILGDARKEEESEGKKGSGGNGEESGEGEKGKEVGYKKKGEMQKEREYKTGGGEGRAINKRERKKSARE